MVTRRTPAEEWIEMSRLLHQLRDQVWAHLSPALCALLRRLPGRGSHTPTPTPQRLSVVQPGRTQPGLGGKGWGVDTYRRLRAADPLLYPTHELPDVGLGDHDGLLDIHIGTYEACPICNPHRSIDADSNEDQQ